MKPRDVRRLIPSVATLSVGLTGCAEDISGDWDVDVFAGMAFPFENSVEATYGEYAQSYSGEATGWMSVSDSLQVSLVIQYVYSYSYTEGASVESGEESSSYTYTGTATSVDRARFQFRLEGQPDSGAGKLNLACTVRAEGVLDCDEKPDGGVYLFSRADQ